MKTLILFLLMLLLAAVGCAPGSYTNAGYQSDMIQLLSEEGLSATDLKCSMLGNGVTAGPDGMCLLTLSEAGVNVVVTGLGLRLKTDDAVTWQPSGADCWTRLDFHDPTASQWYLSVDNAPNLAADNGARFAYFRLFYQPGSAESCISTAYAP